MTTLWAQYCRGELKIGSRKDVGGLAQDLDQWARTVAHYREHCEGLQDSWSISRLHTCRVMLSRVSAAVFEERRNEPQSEHASRMMTNDHYSSAASALQAIADSQGANESIVNVLRLARPLYVICVALIDESQRATSQQHGWCRDLLTSQITCALTMLQNLSDNVGDQCSLEFRRILEVRRALIHP